MAELIPAPFKDLVTRLYKEPLVQDSIFDLHRRHWHLPGDDEPDYSVEFHGHIAGNPLGPAAGPHTQMAQNILLSYVSGARILELKTVQIDDALTIPRPCIDMATIGYNVEWSQELKVAESVREYVAGAMLVEMFRSETESICPAMRRVAGNVIYDMSVGYNLEGIRSAKVQSFLDQMRDASAIVERLRGEIPRVFSAARELDFPTCLSDSITLSTFHGCPADEIERICEFLIAERDVHVIVKMNPPTLGKEQLEHLLYDVMGYTDLSVNPTAYSTSLSLDETVELCERLTRFGAARNRRVGFKFSNTLEVLNHRSFFTKENEVMYLSGQPLHVITMTLTEEFRRAVGPDVPISFSAGVDARNFADTVACGFIPITVSTDLLRPGGYGRFSSYFKRLRTAMEECGAHNLEEFLFMRFDQKSRVGELAGDHPDCSAFDLSGWCNVPIVAQQVRDEERYRAGRNAKEPTRIDSHLTTFDCITCDKCIPVCPNDANFTYPTPIVSFKYQDLIVDESGAAREADSATFEIDEKMQIACYADFCNECGNCDTFCPEYGGPYIKKPSFFGTVESWRDAAPRDGFVVEMGNGTRSIKGRIQGDEFELSEIGDRRRFEDGVVCADFSVCDHGLISIAQIKPIRGEHRVRMNVYHTLKHLLDGVLDLSRVNQVNAFLHESSVA